MAPPRTQLCHHPLPLWHPLFAAASVCAATSLVWLCWVWEEFCRTLLTANTAGKLALSLLTAATTTTVAATTTTMATNIEPKGAKRKIYSYCIFWLAAETVFGLNGNNVICNESQLENKLTHTYAKRERERGGSLCHTDTPSGKHTY